MNRAKGLFFITALIVISADWIIKVLAFHFFVSEKIISIHHNLIKIWTGCIVGFPVIIKEIIKGNTTFGIARCIARGYAYDRFIAIAAIVVLVVISTLLLKKVTKRGFLLAVCGALIGASLANMIEAAITLRVLDCFTVGWYDQDNNILPFAISYFNFADVVIGLCVIVIVVYFIVNLIFILSCKLRGV